MNERTTWIAERNARRAWRLLVGLFAGISLFYLTDRSIGAIFQTEPETIRAFAFVEQVAEATVQKLSSAAAAVWPQTSRSAQASGATKREVIASPTTITGADTSAGTAKTTATVTSAETAQNVSTVANAPASVPLATSTAIALPPSLNATTTNAAWTGGGSSDNWNDTANWAGGLQPQGNDGSTVIHFAGSTRTTPNNDYGPFTLESQILFDSGAASFTLNGNAIKLNFKIENNSANTQTYNMAGLSFAPSVNGGFVELDPTAGDLIVNTPGSSVFLDNNAVLEVFGSHILRMNAPIVNGTSSTGSFALMSNATVVFANANTYTGDTQINAGDLRFALNGALPNSIIRLGGTGADSPAATLSIGTTAAADNNLTVGGTVVVRPSASGTQGTRLLRSLGTSGSTETYSGNIFLDADLTLQSATGSTLVLSGTTDVKTHVLTVDDNSNNVNTQGTVRITGPLTSSLAAGGSLVKNGSNTLIIQSTGNSYTGADPNQLNANGTRIGGGTLGIYGDTSLGNVPAGAYNNIQFTASGTLQDTANNITLNANRNISVATNAVATFDSNGNTFTINGVINGSGGSILKAGNGSVVLANANTYTGNTSVNTGTLNASVANALGGTSGIIINSGGTLLLSNNATTNRISDNASMTLNANGSSTVAFDTGGLSEHGVANNTPGIGPLTLESNSIIDMGNGSSIIAFSNSSGQTVAWGTGRILSIYDWSGNPITGGGTDQMYFGSDATGLTPAQLAEIQFYSGFGTGAYPMGATILPTGEIVPIPEPGTWTAAVLALSAIAYAQRRRFSLRA